jgi:hypothetical protein
MSLRYVWVIGAVATELRGGVRLAQHADRRVCMPRPPGGEPTRHLCSGIKRKKRSRAGYVFAT